MYYSAFATTICGGHREINEDNFFLNGTYRRDIKEKDDSFYVPDTNSTLMAAVFDGIGGMQAGEEASLTASIVTAEKYAGNCKDIGMIISAANDEICHRNRISGYKSGSTCVIVEQNNERFRSWNLGDSRAYLIHGDKILRMSKDHTDAEFMREMGLNTDESRNTLTQYLGIDSTEFIVEPYVSEWVCVERGDQLILCSDGLSGYVSDNEIIKEMIPGGDTRENVLKLIKRAETKGSQDNITILMISILY